MRRTLGTVLVGTILLLACKPHDFDGDGAADIAYVGIDGNWYRAGEAEPFWEVGLPSEGAVPGDYDGEGLWEPAVVLADGTWRTAGAAGDIIFPPPDTAPYSTPLWHFLVIPVPGDYDGDGDTDPAWYDSVHDEWHVAGQPAPGPGGVGEDDPVPSPITPVPADYDGDGDTDMATYSPVERTLSVGGEVLYADLPLGLPLAGKLDESPGADLIIFDTYTNAWARPDGATIPIGVPNLSGVPMLADFDGDGFDDPVVYDWGEGIWYDLDAEVLASDAQMGYGVPATPPAHTIIDLVNMVFYTECVTDPVVMPCD